MIKRLLVLVALFGAFIMSCSDNHHKRPELNTGSFDLDSIKARGRLIAVTDFNSTDYFIYRGEPMGFHYELLKAFCDHLGVDLEIVPAGNNLSEAFDMLNTGKVDLLAFGLTVTESRRKGIQFTEPIDCTRQVLVQRKPHRWENMTSTALEGRLLRKPADLANKSIFVQKGSSPVEQLNLLSGKNNKPVNVIEVPFESEVLIQLVDRGEIEYAVCDEDIALVNSTYYPGIDVSTTLSAPQSLAWGIRKENSQRLLGELNRWITTFRSTQTYAMLYAKYFKNTRSRSIIRSDYYTLSSGKVSQWDDIIKEFSVEIKWDWRLLASLICQESRFIPDVKSRKGAYGLMQVMPETGEHFGIDITTSPRNNIRAGVKFIIFLHSVFDSKITDENERIKFILAAYNAGPGHILDAMKLAAKNGKNPQKWDDNVAEWLQKKTEPRYYNDIDVKNGFFKGKESVAFVNEILARYEHYKNIIPENEEPISYVQR
ncbi:MAG: transporter substrate-binding domain-containing protein [Bacteroidota bacterium]|nr:transporter substrate-binding domain-containing protein [Bacteroidota bacterium]